MKLPRLCPMCGTINSKELDITDKQLSDWKNGGLIQNVFPNLSASEREFIITGYCDNCQELLFGGEEE